VGVISVTEEVKLFKESYLHTVHRPIPKNFTRELKKKVLITEFSEIEKKNMNKYRYAVGKSEMKAIKSVSHDNSVLMEFFLRRED